MGVSFLFAVLSAVVTPTPEGCHPVTPPPGTIAAGECNFDRELAAMDPVLATFGYVFVAVGVILFLGGLFMFAGGRSVLPAALLGRMPRAPATPHDHRIVGLAVMLGSIGAMLGALSGLLALSASWPRDVSLFASLASVAFMTLAAVVALSVRQRYRATSQVATGWEEIGRAFRS